MSDFKPLFYAVIVLLLVGFFVPNVIGIFYDVENIEVSGVLSPVVALISSDWTIDLVFLEINANPFSWLGDTLRSYLASLFIYLSIFPDFLIISFAIIFALSFLYTIIKLLPTT